MLCLHIKIAYIIAHSHCTQRCRPQLHYPSHPTLRCPRSTTINMAGSSRNTGLPRARTAHAAYLSGRTLSPRARDAHLKRLGKEACFYSTTATQTETYAFHFVPAKKSGHCRDAQVDADFIGTAINTCRIEIENQSDLQPDTNS
jgi:hypothetical protein